MKLDIFPLKSLDAGFLNAYGVCPKREGLAGDYNGHTNGLIRDFLTRRTDFRLISDEKIQQIENNLNYRPRKVLSFLKPKEALIQHMAQAA